MTAMWRCGRFSLPLDRTLVMGILNATPDSFSDAGMFADLAVALDHGRAMADEGADIIDIGGESTRPGSEELDPGEELARVRPLVAQLAEELDIPISIDTRHADVAAAAVEAGAAIINDVAGFRDPAMRELAAGCDAGCVVMHMLGEPKTMQENPHYGDVVAEVGAYLLGQARALESAGVARDRIAIDPGLGFGKTVDHNLELLRRLPELTALGYPVLIGASRKRFIGTVLGIETAIERLEGSLAVASWATEHGAAIVRAHDARETVRAVRMTEAIARGRG